MMSKSGVFKGRTIGEFLDESVSKPLNVDKDVFLGGMTPDDQERIAELNGLYFEFGLVLVSA